LLAASAASSNSNQEIIMATGTVKPGQGQQAPKGAPTQPTSIKVTDEMAPVGVVPPTFPADYVAGAVAPYLLSSEYTGDIPMLPMIDLALTKEKAVPVQLWGVAYKDWVPNPDVEGRTVFMQGYEGRGPNNERKRIYMSAITPDLIDSKYRPKIQRFYEAFLADANAGKPMMQHYFEHYYDLYWNLHVAATGKDIPSEVRRYSAGFNGVLGFWYPTTDEVLRAYEETRATREPLKAWLDTRIQAIVDGKTPGADATFVHYWVKNGEFGPNFRRIDVVFECYHNFLALSQWGNMVYNVAAKLEPTKGDPKIRTWFENVMKNGPDTPDGGPFTPLDRFVMELFRVISPNQGSVSIPPRRHSPLASGFTTITTPHPEANMSPLHWENPTEFDPDRYKTAATSAENGEAKCKAVGLARCPFSKEAFHVKDGRDVDMTNSAFGAVYAEVDGDAHPLVDTAGYAPFGFGYRRCAGEYLTMEFIKEFLRKVSKDKIAFVKLPIATPEKVPVNPGTVLDDNIAFKRTN
jgi:hypothetical protein